MAKMNIINIGIKDISANDIALNLKGEPVLRLYGTSADDRIVIDLPPLYYNAKTGDMKTGDEGGITKAYKEVQVAVFAGPGDDWISTVPGFNQSEVTYYGDNGTGSEGASFPWPTVNVGSTRYFNNIDTGAGGDVAAGTGSTFTTLHGAGASFENNPTVIRKFNPNNDDLMAAGSRGVEVDDFHFKKEGNVNKLMWVELEFESHNRLLDGQKAVLKFENPLSTRATSDAALERFVDNMVDRGHDGIGDDWLFGV